MIEISLRSKSQRDFVSDLVVRDNFSDGSQFTRMMREGKILSVIGNGLTNQNLIEKQS